MDSVYEGWSTSRRVKAAIDKVEKDGWSQSEAAVRFGISRSNLNRRLGARRKVVERESRSRSLSSLDPAGQFIDENRRLPESLADFVDTYFTGWSCPDCSTHHPVPQFQEEIWSAIDNPEFSRVLINIPPYHSKSTIISVWDTVRKTARNPNLRTALVSQTEVFASAFLQQVRKILADDDLYRDSRRNLIADFGPFVPAGQESWSNTELFVHGRSSAEKDPTVMALGIGTQIYGRRFDEIKFDDVATTRNMRNPDVVAQIISQIDKEHMTRVGKSGRVIFVGTRVRPGDIYSVYAMRSSYKVIRYPALLDDHLEEVLWPEHFPYSQLMVHREEMSPSDFQLIYQNVDIPGLNASFSADLLDACKDVERPIGHHQSTWKVVAGLDPAGGNKESGYTAFTVLGVNLATGQRYVIDSRAYKSMKAPQIMEEIKQLSEMYPISEWRVESNGLQSQIVQYNVEIVQWLANRGVKVTPHFTHGNKWDPQFGVETISSLMHAGLLSIPWGGAPTAKQMQPLIEEFVSFPMGQTSDRVMSLWFAELGIRDLLRRMDTPLFDNRRRMPKRIMRKRRVVNFETKQVSTVPMRDQRPGVIVPGQHGGRKAVVGAPTRPDLLDEVEEEVDDFPEFANIDFKSIWRPDE